MKYDLHCANFYKIQNHLVSLYIHLLYQIFSSLDKNKECLESN